MDRQTLRDWAHAYNAKWPNGLIKAISPGRPSKLTGSPMQSLRVIAVAFEPAEPRWRV
jgi:hypothetical protein